MPTVIILDVSLSVGESISNQVQKDPQDGDKEGTARTEIRQMASAGIGVLLDYLTRSVQREYTALVVFSSVRQDFTQNYELIRKAVQEVQPNDKPDIVLATRGVLKLKLDEWAKDGTINIIVVTSGQYHQGKSFHTDHDWNIDEADDIIELKDQFDIPCKMQVVCLTPNLLQEEETKLYKRLVMAVDSTTTDCPILSAHNMKDFKQSAIWVPEPNGQEVSVGSVEKLFAILAETHYKPFNTIVSFGHLSSMVLLSPSPTECLLKTLKNEFDDLKTEEQQTKPASETFVSALNRSRLFKLDDEITICGFLPMSDIANPAVVSRHLVLPIANAKFNEIRKAQQILSQDPNAYKSTQAGRLTNTVSGNITGAMNSKSTQGDDVRVGRSSTSSTAIDVSQELDDGKQPSFCVLLHHCLKQENMAAVCLVGKSDEKNEDWFAILYPQVDSKKKSSLFLSLLMPGSQPIPWLPNFRSLGSTCLNADSSSSISDRPVNSRSSSKSYSSNNVIWLNPESVQADVQKVVRYARRGPDKVPQFYKELNRIRRAALSYGFFDVLSGLANILEKEKRYLMSDTSRPANQVMLQHINHVISSLRTRLPEDCYDVNILPIA